VFSNVLLSKHRCDLQMSLEDEVVSERRALRRLCKHALLPECIAGQRT